MECPLCKGTGNVPNRCEKMDDAALRKKAVLLLSQHGYGVRETQRVIGYRSPRSVSAILDAERKKPNSGSEHNTAALNKLKVPEKGDKSRAWNEAIEACIEEISALPFGAHNKQSTPLCPDCEQQLICPTCTMREQDKYYQ